MAGERVLAQWREVDVVLAGFRWHKDEAGEAIGSLLLGLFDVYGSPPGFAVTPSSPAPSNRSNQSWATARSRVTGVT